MNRFLLIALGAALGANARYLVGVWAGERLGADFPYGTLIVNVTGSFLAGFLLTLASGRLAWSPDLLLFLKIGFLGSYTTFSSFSYETMALWRVDGSWPALVNVIGNNLLALLAVFFGAIIAHWLEGGG